MVTISEVSYRKSIYENSDSEMDVDMELKLDEENMVVVKSPMVTQGGKAARPLRSPKAVRKTVARKSVAPVIKVSKAIKGGKVVKPPKNSPKTVKKTVVAMKIKATPNAKADESKSKHTSTAEMVTEALVSLKSRKGITMASIRNYIQQHYGVQSKRRDNSMKDVLKELFQNGELGNLEPSKDGALKFNNRFWFTPEN